MAILDQKERIIDFQLTDYGRELLAKNQLNFTYYAFSDEGIDYSGSMEAANLSSGTFENYVHRDLSFEADQRQDRDVKSFLYTVSVGNGVLPEFKTSSDANVDISLERKYEIQTLVLHDTKTTIVKTPVDVVFRMGILRSSEEQRAKDYADQQKLLAFLADL